MHKFLQDALRLCNKTEHELKVKFNRRKYLLYIIDGLADRNAQIDLYSELSKLNDKALNDYPSSQ